MPLVKDTFRIETKNGVLIELEAEGQPEDMEYLGQSLKEAVESTAHQAEKETSVEVNGLEGFRGL